MILLMVDLSRRLVPFLRFPDAFEGALRCGLVEAFERLKADPFFAGLRRLSDPEACVEGAADMVVSLEKSHEKIDKFDDIIQIIIRRTSTTHDAKLSSPRRESQPMNLLT